MKNNVYDSDFVFANGTFMERAKRGKGEERRGGGVEEDKRHTRKIKYKLRR